MKSSQKYIILGGAILILVVLMFFLTRPSNTVDSIGKTDSKPDSLFIKKPVNPSGTFLLYQLLRNYKKTASLQKIQTSRSKTLESLLPVESANNLPNVYVAITEEMYLNEEDETWLLEFVEEGNFALISSDKLSYGIKAAISNESYFSDNQYYDTSFTLNFYHPDYKANKNIEVKNGELNSHLFPKYKNWSYYLEEDINSSFIKIAYNESEDYPICIMAVYGRGGFIIHSTPPAFSNINMLEKGGKYHAETIFSHLPKGNIYWHHDFGKYSPYRGSTNPSASSSDNSNKPQYPKSSPLQYILRVPALFAALMLLIFGAILYMLFQSKRRQRVIPPVESNENSSVEFVETVSKLYFQQKRHDKLIKHKEKLFLSFLRQQYFISTPKITNEFILKVASKSGIEENKVKAIFNGFKHGKANRGATDQQLIDLYNKLEYFYKNCS